MVLGKRAFDLSLMTFFSSSFSATASATGNSVKGSDLGSGLRCSDLIFGRIFGALGRRWTWTVVIHGNHCCHQLHFNYSVAIFFQFLALNFSKLPIIGFCPSSFDISINTILYGVCFLRTILYNRSSWFLTQASFNRPSLTCRSVCSCRCCPISSEARRFFCQSSLFCMLLINSLWNSKSLTLFKYLNCGNKTETLWIWLCYYHVTYEFQRESKLYSLPECQGTPSSKQVPYLKFKWQQRSLNLQLLSS